MIMIWMWICIHFIYLVQCCYGFSQLHVSRQADPRLQDELLSLRRPGCPKTTGPSIMMVSLVGSLGSRRESRKRGQLLVIWWPRWCWRILLIWVWSLSRRTNKWRPHCEGQIHGRFDLHLWQHRPYLRIRRGKIQKLKWR